MWDFDPDKSKHENGPRHWCGCTGCEGFRQKRVTIGSLVRPATKDPAKYNGGGQVPAWPRHEWERVGWNFRLELNGITWGVVIGIVPDNERDSGGHLHCVEVMWNDLVRRVTSSSWLVVLSNAGVTDEAS